MNAFEALEKNSETKLQMDLAEAVQKQWGHLGVRTSSTALGSNIGAGNNAKATSMGYQDGYPDLSIYIESVGAIYLELKTKKGKQSKAQKDWQGFLNSLPNVQCHCLYGYANAFAMLNDIFYNTLKQSLTKRAFLALQDSFFYLNPFGFFVKRSDVNLENPFIFDGEIVIINANG